MKQWWALVLAVGLVGCDAIGGGSVDFGGDGARPGGGNGSIPAGQVHPNGFASADVHGLETMLQQQDCRGCHGQQLEGSIGPSCDGCHTPAEPKAWQSDCAFCHGDTALTAPRGLDGSPGGRFAAHGAHLQPSMATAMTCTACHNSPTNVLSDGHAFDDTPGFAENLFTASIAPETVKTDAGCSNNYCHGTGLANGTVTLAAAPMTCSSCHPSQANPQGAGQMSGDHSKHLGENGITCGDCHSQVTSNGLTLVNAALHIDGANQVAFQEAGFTYDPATKTCDGVCHGDDHQNERW